MNVMARLVRATHWTRETLVGLGGDAAFCSALRRSMGRPDEPGDDDQFDKIESPP
jgi:hypothetical protein